MRKSLLITTTLGLAAALPSLSMASVASGSASGAACNSGFFFGLDLKGMTARLRVKKEKTTATVSAKEVEDNGLGILTAALSIGGADFTPEDIDAELEFKKLTGAAITPTNISEAGFTNVFPANTDVDAASVAGKDFASNKLAAWLFISDGLKNNAAYKNLTDTQAIAIALLKSGFTGLTPPSEFTKAHGDKAIELINKINPTAYKAAVEFGKKMAGIVNNNANADLKARIVASAPATLPGGALNPSITLNDALKEIGMYRDNNKNVLVFSPTTLYDATAETDAAKIAAGLGIDKMTVSKILLKSDDKANVLDLLNGTFKYTTFNVTGLTPEKSQQAFKSVISSFTEDEKKEMLKTINNTKEIMSEDKANKKVNAANAAKDSKEQELNDSKQNPHYSAMMGGLGATAGYRHVLGAFALSGRISADYLWGNFKNIDTDGKSGDNDKIAKLGFGISPAIGVHFLASPSAELGIVAGVRFGQLQAKKDKTKTAATAADKTTTTTNSKSSSGDYESKWILMPFVQGEATVWFSKNISGSVYAGYSFPVEQTFDKKDTLISSGADGNKTKVKVDGVFGGLRVAYHF